jgi:hypothetical protein
MLRRMSDQETHDMKNYEAQSRNYILRGEPDDALKTIRFPTPRKRNHNIFCIRAIVGYPCVSRADLTSHPIKNLLSSSHAAPPTPTPAPVALITSEAPSAVDSSGPPTTGPVSSAPMTATPTTASPVEVPVTTSPVGAGPTTTGPVSASPVTTGTVSSAPITTGLISAAPATTTPLTLAPAATSPVTSAPIATVPVSSAPATAAPVTVAPVTQFPSTSAPSTIDPASATTSPVTLAPAATGDSCPAVPLDGCSVCGDGLCVTEPDAIFTIPGQPALPCGLLEQAGFNGQVPLDLCPLLPPLINELCACDS